MKKNIIIAAIAALAIASCAKSTSSDSTGADAQRYFESWVSVNGAGWTRTDLGAYIISETPGTGEVLGDQDAVPYVLVNYTITSLTGSPIGTTDESLARQWGYHSNKYTYQPMIFTRADNSMYAGIDEILAKMKIGGKCKFAIPGYLLTTSRYGTAEEYVSNYDGSNNNAIYEIEVVDTILNITAWELAKIDEYVNKYCPDAVCDSTGFYRKVITPSTTGEAFQSDTTIYVNYIGRTIDGHLFDTNIRDTANRYFREDFSESTYQASQINWKTEYTSITMTSSESSVINGFAYLLGKMGPYERAVGIFYSDRGYSSSGISDDYGVSIPSYCPLIFDIQVVDNPEDD